MLRWIILSATHLAALVIGFAVGVYALPILVAPAGPDKAALQATQADAMFTGRFDKTLKGSDFLHWGEGVVHVSRNKISHEGRLSPGPDYKVYLSPEFIDTKEGFFNIKDRARRIGDVKTFDGFIVDVPPDVDVTAFNTVVVWCEAFNQFISAAKYK